MDKTVAFHTLGCRLNISETGSIARQFTNRGYRVVEFGELADITFLNTCTVTDKADSTCRNLIRKAKKISPEGQIIVAGCYAQMAPQEIAKMDVDLILGSDEKNRVFEYLEKEHEEIIKIDRTNEFWGAATTEADGHHTRAFLKIQDGCNYVCSYCIIPFARGRSRTISIEKAVHEARQIIASGFKEIILTGVNIGEYERQSGEKFSRLVYELTRIPGLLRLRLSSVEPNTIDDELLSILADAPCFMPHFHVPLQSGHDEILKLMKRKYDLDQYASTLAKIKKIFPHAGVGADVIAGFPGESEAQFEETYNFVLNSPITHIHAFPFSKRQGTVAAKMEGQIPYSLKKERTARLNSLREKKLEQFSLSTIGQSYEVLFESEITSGISEGYTPHYLNVRVSGSELKNKILPVKIISYENKILKAQILL